jgi:hypothetical protein
MKMKGKIGGSRLKKQREVRKGEDGSRRKEKGKRRK